MSFNATSRVASLVSQRGRAKEQQRLSQTFGAEDSLDLLGSLDSTMEGGNRRKTPKADRELRSRQELQRHMQEERSRRHLEKTGDGQRMLDDEEEDGEDDEEEDDDEDEFVRARRLRASRDGGAGGSSSSSRRRRANKEGDAGAAAVEASGMNAVRASTESRVSNILKYLDEVEQDPVATVAPAPAMSATHHYHPQPAAAGGGGGGGGGGGATRPAWGSSRRADATTHDEGKEAAPSPAHSAGGRPEVAASAAAAAATAAGVGTLYDWEVESDTQSMASAVSNRFFTAPVAGGIAGGPGAVDTTMSSRNGGGSPSMAGGGASSSSSSSSSASTTTVASVYGGVKAKLAALQVEVNDKTRTIAALKVALRTARQSETSLAKTLQQEERARAAALRSEYETSVSRHLAMIDELLKDKKELSAECERVAREAQETTSRYDATIAGMATKHRDTLKKQREASLANDRARLDQWEREQTKKIKQMTIKGLEPEIQRLLGKHKAELKRSEQRHDAALGKLRDELHSQHQATLDREKAAHRDAIEELVRRERSAAEQRVQEVVQRSERGLAAERKRAHEEAERARSRFDGLLEQCRGRHADEVEQLRGQHAKEMESAQRRIAADRESEVRRQGQELKAAKEAEAIEREQWQQRMLVKMRQDLQEKERALKGQLEAHRDAQLEMIVKRLDEETHEQRQQAEEEMREEMAAAAQRAEAEVRSARQAAAAQADRCNDLIKAHSSEVGEAEGQARLLRERVEDLASQLEAARSECAAVRATAQRQEREAMQEFADKRAADAEATRERAEQLRGQVARWQEEAQRVKGDSNAQSERHQAELDKVHDRVRQTVARRDDTIRQLRAQLEEAALKAHHTEQLLEKQRQELLA
eukprot:g2622.t1